MPSSEIVEVQTAAGRWTAFKRVQVEAAVNEACRSFELHVSAVAGAQGTNFIFQNFAPLQVFAGGGELMVSGYIDRRQPKLSSREACMTISGRSKGQDAVDCSAIHETGNFQNKTALQIAQEIDIYGVGYASDLQFDPIANYQLTPGETVHREVERLCRDQGATLFGQADGSVKLWNASAGLQRQGGALIEGYNLFDGEADHNCANRHSHTHVRGQASKGTGKDVHEYEAIAQDSGVTRTRRALLVHDGDTDKTRASKRATNRRDRAAGNGLRATIKTIGWRDDDGTLWTPGYRIYVESPFLDIAQDMLIEKVTYVQEEGEEEGAGTTASLSLVDPRAYGGQGGGSNKSGSAWSIDNSDAS